ncbi:tail assembly chaperone, partial [Escherichia coli]
MILDRHITSRGYVCMRPATIAPLTPYDKWD